MAAAAAAAYPKTPVRAAASSTAAPSTAAPLSTPVRTGTPHTPAALALSATDPHPHTPAAMSAAMPAAPAPPRTKSASYTAFALPSSSAAELDVDLDEIPAELRIPEHMFEFLRQRVGCTSATNVWHFTQPHRRLNPVLDNVFPETDARYYDVLCVMNERFYSGPSPCFGKSCNSVLADSPDVPPCTHLSINTFNAIYAAYDGKRDILLVQQTAHDARVFFAYLPHLQAVEHLSIGTPIHLARHACETCAWPWSEAAKGLAASNVKRLTVSLLAPERFRPADSAGMWEFLTCKRFEKLSLRSTRLSPQREERTLNVERMKLHDCPPGCIVNACNAFDAQSGLREFDITDSLIGTESWMDPMNKPFSAVARLLPLTGLTTLKLSSCDLGGPHFEELAAAAAEPSSALRSLDISFNFFDTAGLNAVAPLLATLEHLVMKVWQTGENPPTNAAFEEALAKTTTLEKLDINQWFTANLALARGLARNTSVTDLYISGYVRDVVVDGLFKNPIKDMARHDILATNTTLTKVVFTDTEEDWLCDEIVENREAAEAKIANRQRAALMLYCWEQMRAGKSKAVPAGKHSLSDQPAPILEAVAKALIHSWTVPRLMAPVGTETKRACV